MGIGVTGQVQDEACEDCNLGPTGVAGHDRLYSHTMSPTEMHFSCRACGRYWARPHESPYTWKAIKSPTGADVPGRPGTTPP